MLIKTGWQNDYGKQKFDIELNEIDLGRILAEHDIPPDASLTSAEVFRLLMLEAEYFSENVRGARLADAEARAVAGNARASRDALLGKIKVRLGLEQSFVS
jgi:hypothetical protein